MIIVIWTLVHYVTDGWEGKKKLGKNLNIEK